MSSAAFRFGQNPTEREGEEQRRQSQRLHLLTYLRIGILVLLLFAFALRMFRLDGQSLWYDEGVTAEVAQRSFVELIEWTARDIQPPLYYLVVAGWGRISGWSEWSLRFPSLFFGMLTLPLLYLFALRLTRSRTAAAVTILFAALHPLLIYYCQEARMYAQLIALGVLVAYFLLLVAIRGADSTRLWIGYVLAATAAIYTHYFAFFLLFALGLAFCIDLLLSSRPPENRYPFPTLRNFALVNVLILFLYLPWINVMFARLAVDTSYWQGRFKIWEALRTISMTFVAGETILEAQASQLLPAALMLTLLSILILLWRFVFGIPSRPVGSRVLLYSFLWLIVPIGVVLLLSSFVPKFNSRYVMIALPGLLLLWSSALATLLDPLFLRLRRENLEIDVDVLGRPITLRHSLLGAIALIICIIFLAIFLRSTVNWFTDPAFTKAQWRELASYVRTHRSEREKMFLVSGHAWPIWNYYAPDLPANRLPDIEILDVNSVLGFEKSAALLRSAFDTSATGANAGAWLISWQDEVTDPMGVVPLHLQLAGHAVPVDAEFWQLGLRHFTEIDAQRVQPSPSILLDEPINFGDRLSLVAYALLENGDLVLYWLSHDSSPTGAELHITLKTDTDERFPYRSPEDRRPAGYLYPFFRWQPNQLAVGQIPASDWAGAGAIPGKYRVVLGVYDPEGDVAGLDVVGAQGQLLGKRADLDLILNEVVGGASRGELVELAEGLSASVALNADAVQPGEPLLVDLWWMVSEAALTDEAALEVVWRSGDDEAVVGRADLLFDNDFVPTEWPVGTVMHSVQRVSLPDEVADRPGRYLLDFQIRGGGGGVIRKELGLLQSQREFTAPPLLRTPLDIILGTEIRLLGVEEVLPVELAVDGELLLNIYWEALTEPSADYTLTIQWIDESGIPVRQLDEALTSGSSTWVMGEIVGQTLLSLAPTEPGTYQLILALYHANERDFPRLATELGDDFIGLGTIEVR